MVSLVTAFSQLFVGEVVCIFGCWQRAAAAAAAAEAFLRVFFENNCHCTPVTGTEISQPVASLLQWCQDVPGILEQATAEQSRVGPHERRGPVLSSSSLSLCMMPGDFTSGAVTASVCKLSLCEERLALK